MDDPLILQARLAEIGAVPTTVPVEGKVPCMEGWADWPAGTQHVGEDTALITGAVSGVFVVDCDDPEAAQSFIEKYAPPETFTVQTKRGVHFYFRHPGFAVGNSKGKILPHVDIRGDRGYVVAPGSTDKHIAMDLPIAPAPEALLEAIRNSRIANDDAPGARAPIPVDGEMRESRMLLAREYLASAAPAIEGQDGSGALWAVAIHLMRKLELSIEDAHQLIVEHYNPRCQPPWSGEEINHKLANARDNSPIPTGIAPPGFLATVPRVTLNGLASYFEQFRNRSRADRIPMGLPKLDESCRGGLPWKKLVVLGGAPGAGKTALAIQIGVAQARAGRPVVILACDESADGLFIRIAQQMGFSRDKIDDGDLDELARFEEAVLDLPIALVDMQDGARLEDILSALKEPSVLVVDSLQTLPSSEHEITMEMLVRMQVTVGAVKGALAAGHIVIATSELNRGYYRSNQTAEEANPLAAFKYSGDVEYALHLALVLRNRAGTANVVDVAVPKNRLGTKRDVTLLFDHDRALFEESLNPVEEIRDPVQKAKQRAMEWIRAHVDIMPQAKTTLAEHIGGKQQTMRKAIEELIDEGALAQDRKLMINLPQEELARLSGITT